MNFIKKINLKTLLFCLLTFIIGWQLGHRDLNLQWQNYQPKVTFQNQAPSLDKNIDFKLFWQTWNLLTKEYVDKKALDPQKMYYGAIQGMVSALGDPYTVFLPPEAQKSTKEELGGSFEGVGIQLGFDKDKRLVVIAPLKGTPADKAGIKPGDLILKIDQKDTTGMSLPEAVSLIRGKKSSQVALQIYHDGDKKPIDLSLTRDTIIVKSVEYSQKTTPSGKNIAYIKLSRFGEKTNSEWDQAISDALSKAPDGVILDLRNNPGGFLDGAVFIGSEFISSGDIVLQQGADGNKVEYKVNRVGRLTKLPLVVLINKGSASASEIVAGAIQDYKRGQLVGDQSFGKGTIQEAQELPEDTGIHITTAKWLTPNGRWIHNIGLTPDVAISLGDDTTKDNQLEKALSLLDS
ncbi:S41 family peptidase [Candidatus Daviesbacteria bacterium]|nr:S41 family peptidase [Candidatus Daviesbacteria bacterium]